MQDLTQIDPYFYTKEKPSKEKGLNRRKIIYSWSIIKRSLQFYNFEGFPYFMYKQAKMKENSCFGEPNAQILKSD